MSTGMSEKEFRDKYGDDVVITDNGPVNLVDFIKAACKEFKAEGLVMHVQDNARNVEQKSNRDSVKTDVNKR